MLRNPNYLIGPLTICCLFISPSSGDPPESQAYSLRHEVVLEAPVAQVWKAFTTHEGLESWMATKVTIDLRIGGSMRSVFKPEAVIGDESTMESTILSLEPLRMISLRPTRAPGDFPFPNAMKKSWTVTYFEPLTDSRTKLTMIGLGFTDEPESIKMREYFDKGNAKMLERLAARFPKSGETEGGEKALQRLAGLVGGEWIHETLKPDGGAFRARSILEKGPDGKSLVGRGWLGDAAGMSYHGATQIWLEPGTLELRFQNVSDDGSVARGSIVAAGSNEVRWDWNAHSPNGKKTRYRVDMIFDDADHYTFVLHELMDGATPTERVRVKYQRVSQAPEAFLKLKPAKP